jgi:hypothetical protein
MSGAFQYVKDLNANCTQNEVATWWKLQDVKMNDSKRTGLEKGTGRVPLFMRNAIKKLPKWTEGIVDTYMKALNFSKNKEKQLVREQWKVNR